MWYLWYAVQYQIPHGKTPTIDLISFRSFNVEHVLHVTNQTTTCKGMWKLSTYRNGMSVQFVAYPEFPAYQWISISELINK